MRARRWIPSTLTIGFRRTVTPSWSRRRKPGCITRCCTQERPGYHLRAELPFRDLCAEDYEGLFVSGGRAPEYLRYDADLLRAVRAIAAAGKPIACLCHGIEILTAAGCIAGKRVTTVPKCALDAEQGGATYVADPVVVDGQLVTGRGYGDNTELLKQFLQLLKAYRERNRRPATPPKSP
jgi:protease I